MKAKTESDLKTQDIIEKMTAEIPKMAKEYGMKADELWRAIYLTVQYRMKKKV